MGWSCGLYKGLTFTNKNPTEHYGHYVKGILRNRQTKSNPNYFLLDYKLEI